MKTQLSQDFIGGTAQALRYHSLQETNRLGEPVNCKICYAEAGLFDVLDFSKSCVAGGYDGMPCGVPVYYHRCRRCGFIFTGFFDRFTASQWTDLLYNDRYYSNVDPDYAEVRPRGNAIAVDSLISSDKDRIAGLNYGGGNGKTARLLRDMGYRYDNFDPYGDRSMTPELVHRYEFCSVFEVAEHTPDPLNTLREIVSLCNPGRLAILVGTHTTDANVDDNRRLAWWYAAPRNGHISLHSKASLQALATAAGLQCLNFTEQTHLLYREMSRREAMRFLVKGKIRSRLRMLLNRP